MTGMNELRGCLGLGEGGVEHESESGVLNFILHSKPLLVSEGVTYSQVSVVIILFFLDTVFVLFCIIINL
jgi:hypothetical protein